MTTHILTHPVFADHIRGAQHPEQSARMDAVWRTLKDDKFAALNWHEAPMVDRDMLALVHPAHHIDGVLGAVPKSGMILLDEDTVMSPASGEAGLRAVGAVTSAIDCVMKDGGSKAFCAVRPPGHHAEPDRAMGFCLFNSVAIGARHAQKHHGLKRIAIVDFDVHHGNGTQAAFEKDASVFFASSHQHPLYPGTGMADETGAGNILNTPLPPGTASQRFRAAYETRVLPALDAFAPELILVSAGFDAHRADPLAALELEADDYAWITDRLIEAASRHAQGRLVSMLEGGYDLRALGDSVAAHVSSLMAA